MKKIAIFSCIFLQSCASVYYAPWGEQPYVHPDAINKPLSETAVFLTKREESSAEKIVNPDVFGINQVNGKVSYCHWNQGCPIWIRVNPGDYTFGLVAKRSTGTAFITTTTSIEIKNMKAGYAYVASYSKSEKDSKKINIRIDEIPAKDAGLWTTIPGTETPRFIPLEP